MTVTPPAATLEGAAPDLYRAKVQQITPLSSHLIRITFSGQELESFHALGFDHHVHLLFPTDGSRTSQEPQICPHCGIVVANHDPSNGQGMSMRAFTVRKASAVLQILEIDFALHPHDGPAISWVRQAQLGDEVLIASSPLPPAEQLGWQPAGHSKFLLIGDETARPAITAIARALPSHQRVEALIEVPTEEDRIPIHAGPHVAVQWLPRQTEEDSPPQEYGRLIHAALDQWLTHLEEATAAYPPEAGLFIWVAGKEQMVATVADRLRQNQLLETAKISAHSYWQ